MSVSVDVETQTLQNPEGRDTGGGRLGGTALRGLGNQGELPEGRNTDSGSSGGVEQRLTGIEDGVCMPCTLATVECLRRQWESF